MKEIPVEEAKTLANKYDYDQVIILGLKNSKKEEWFDGWRTTFNKNKSKCQFLGKVAHILMYNFRAFYSNEKVTEDYYGRVNKEDKL